MKTRSAMGAVLWKRRGETMAERKRLLIRGGRVITLDSALGDFDRGDVLVEGDTIRAVGPHLEAGDAEVIDATGMIVMPGFVDAHRHIWQTQFRTIATDWSLFDYMVWMRTIYGAFYRPEDVYLANYVGTLEALNAGITTIVDHCHVINSPEHADEAIRGLRDGGIRGVFCYGIFSNPSYTPGAPFDRQRVIDQAFGPVAPWRWDDMVRVHKQHFGGSGDLLRFGVAPAELEFLSLEAGRVQIEKARAAGAYRLSCHAGMGALQRQVQIVKQLKDTGLLKGD
ncbi:MAG: amidohydrolase family protein, partial [Alphaproteobacteria bacterium]|nr:amidohydrolase family protein [Alphaproteobacteria bacterium]